MSLRKQTTLLIAALLLPCLAAIFVCQIGLEIPVVTEAIVTSSYAADQKYQDVLDVPSIKSALAAKSLLNGITMAGNRLVCVGQRGHIVYSDDQGKTWLQADVPVSSDLVAVQFPTPVQGWAVGHDGVVLHSSNGGATWVKQLDGRSAAKVLASYYGYEEVDQQTAGKPEGIVDDRFKDEIKRFVDEGPDKPFLDVWFENELTGYIIGAFNLIFRTTDGGKTWEPWLDRTENPMQLHLHAMQLIDDDLFICGEQGLVMKLDRQMARFRAVDVPYNGTFFGLTGKPGATIVFGLRGNVFLSRDGGSNWQKIETNLEVGITGGTVTADGKIVLVSQGGHVLVSSNDGASFNQITIDSPFPATGVIASGNDTVTLIGFSGNAVQKIK